MEVSNEMFAKSILASAGAFALTTTFAAAEVVCNEDGDCWRVPRALRVQARTSLKSLSKRLALAGK